MNIGQTIVFKKERVEYLSKVLEFRKYLNQDNQWYKWYNDSIQLASVIAFLDATKQNIPPIYEIDEQQNKEQNGVDKCFTGDNSYAQIDESNEILFCTGETKVEPIIGFESEITQTKIPSWRKRIPEVYLFVNLDMNFNSNWLNEVPQDGIKFVIRGFVHSSVVHRISNMEELQSTKTKKAYHMYCIEPWFFGEWNDMYKMDYCEHVKSN